MRVPSRFLFPLAAKPRLSLPRLLLAIIIVGALIGGVIAALGSGAWWILLVLLIVTMVSNRRWRMRRAKLAEQRAGQTICQFARAFDISLVDSWVIRAVWLTLDNQLNQSMPSVPALAFVAGDRLDEDLELVGDDDDLYELLQEAAQRCGRDLSGLEDNPWLPVLTVGDMVRALNAQPMTPARQQRIVIHP